MLEDSARGPGHRVQGLSGHSCFVGLFHLWLLVLETDPGTCALKEADDISVLVQDGRQMGLGTEEHF